jgi:hypothetical protein
MFVAERLNSLILANRPAIRSISAGFNSEDSNKASSQAA